MTYLELVNRFRQETNYANTGPTTVAGQGGDHARAVSWIADAYTDIQNRHLWRWLRKDFTLTAQAGLASYAPTQCQDPDGDITRFKRWVMDGRNPVRCYLASSGVGAEYWLTPVPWEYFRTIYQLGEQQPGAPAFIAVDPDDNLVLGPTPGDSYIISGEYHRSAQILSLDGDMPEMPQDYHRAIVYQAMEDHGYFESATEVIARGEKKLRRMLRQLESTQMPTMRKAGPLA